MIGSQYLLLCRMRCLFFYCHHLTSIMRNIIGDKTGSLHLQGRSYIFIRSSITASKLMYGSDYRDAYITVCFAVSVLGTATFRVGNQTLQYPTLDLFEVEVAPYTTRGILVDAVFNENAACEILPSILDTARSALNSVTSDNITSVIIAIDAKKAKYRGCKTVTHAGFAVSALNQYLNATSGFSIDTILYMHI
ncbi:hypothetical protein BDF19DRAFT_463077, partial [Syncephalis fuscata]